MSAVCDDSIYDRLQILHREIQNRVMQASQTTRLSSKAVRTLLNLQQTTSARQLSSTTSLRATALPITATGPPPSAPVPSRSQHVDRIERRQRQAEKQKLGKEIRAGKQGKQSHLRKRFW